MSNANKDERLRQEINALNKVYGGGAKIAHNPQTLDAIQDDAMLRKVLEQHVHYASEMSLVSAGALKTDGHVPAELAFDNNDEKFDFAAYICS